MRNAALTLFAGALLAGSSSLAFAQAVPPLPADSQLTVPADNPAGVADTRTDSPAAHHPGGTTNVLPPETTGSVNMMPDTARSTGNPAGVCDNTTASPAAPRTPPC